VSVLAAAGALAVPAIAYGLPYAVRRFEVARLRRLCSERGAFVLSYDDGPGSTITPRLLDILRDSDVRANFFPLGMRVPGNEAILDRMAAEGHEIGCHSFQHRHAWKVAPGVAWHDARAGFSALEGWVEPNGLFRPPHGKIDLLTWLAVRKRGAQIAWWTQDCADTAPNLPDPAQIERSAIQAGGGVLLLHDFDRAPDRVRYVLDLTERLITRARREQITLCTLGELVTPLETRIKP